MSFSHLFQHLKSKRYDGFSLVELAIVLVIIGLLVGAVLKGQELLESARLKTIMTQLNQYRLATNTFVDRYGALPGDFDKASSYIKTGLKNGNNNGRIEGFGLSGSGGTSNHEALSFWEHLAAAELIPNASPPSTKLGGIITIAHAPSEGMQGHWFVIGNPNGSKNDGALLTPLQCLSIAKKLDTEDPFSGNVQMRNAAQKGGDTQCLKANKILNTAIKNPACVLYVKL